MRKRIVFHVIVLTLLLCFFCSRLQVTVMPGDYIAASDVESIQEERSALMITRELGLLEEPTESSMQRLSQCGCTKIQGLRKNNEEDGLISFTIIDTDGKFYYVDTDYNGNFDSVLSEMAHENAEILSVRLDIDSGDLFHAAEALSGAGVKKIIRIRNIVESDGYWFDAETEDGKFYRMGIGTDGTLKKVDCADACSSGESAAD